MQLFCFFQIHHIVSRMSLPAPFLLPIAMFNHNARSSPLAGARRRMFVQDGTSIHIWRENTQSTKNQIGGVETVTLGDEEARARRTQKSVLERKAPPTFPFLIEMRERHYWVTHRTERSVDMLLHGKKPLVEVRKRDNEFQVVTERWATYDGDGL